MNGNIGNLLRAHWRGDLPLFWTIAVPLVVVHIAVALAMTAGRDFETPYRFGLLVIVAPIIIWQIIGAIRCTDRTMHSHIGMVGPGVSYMVIILVALSTVGRSVALFLPNWVPAEPAHIDVPAVLLQVDLPNVHLSGVISLVHYAELAALIQRENGQIQRITLDSIGGNVHAARGLARLIETSGLNTHVSGECLSACTLILLAGMERTAEEGAAIGFHQYRVGTYKNLGDLVMFDAEEEQQKDLAYFTRRGVSEVFLQQIFQADADSIWQPDHGALKVAGVLTD